MEPNEKKALKERIQPALEELNISANTGRHANDVLNERMAVYKNWRVRHDRLSAQPPLQGIKHYGNKLNRIASYYLDDSGTKEADSRNQVFYERIATEEGMRDFVQKVAKDMLSIDLKAAFFIGTAEEAAEYYAQHTQECELGWAVLDLLNDAKDMLDPTVYDALQDRKVALQSMGVYERGAAIIGSPFYTLVPDTSREFVENAVRLDNTNFYEQDQFDDNREIKDFNRYVGSMEYFYSQIDVAVPLQDAGIELLEQNKIDPYTVFRNEKGDRLNLMKAVELKRNGGKVVLEHLPSQEELDKKAKELTEKEGPEAAAALKNQPTRDALEKVMAGHPAERPIKMPGKENRGIYDNFSKEALGAQGKGLQEEYRKLLGTMNGATYWFAHASDEFRNIRTELKRLGESDTVPNRDESLQSMEKILKWADKYVTDKEDRNLKAREQKRLDAVKAVRDSLRERRSLLSMANVRADAEHAYNATETGATSLRNQENFHINPFDQKVSTCRTTVADYAREEGAVGELAQAVTASLDEMKKYAVDPNFDKDKQGFIYGPSFERHVAEMAVLGVVLRERRLPGDAPHPVEDGLKKMSETEGLTKKTMMDLCKTETVKTAVREIRENPENAAKYIDSNGSGKLADMLIGEIGMRRQPKEKVSEAPEKKMSEPVVGGPAK